jgi:hypothetical protein
LARCIRSITRCLGGFARCAGRSPSIAQTATAALSHDVRSRGIGDGNAANTAIFARLDRGADPGKHMGSAGADLSSARLYAHG